MRPRRVEQKMPNFVGNLPYGILESNCTIIIKHTLITMMKRLFQNYFLQNSNIISSFIIATLPQAPPRFCKYCFVTFLPKIVKYTAICQESNRVGILA